MVRRKTIIDISLPTIVRIFEISVWRFVKVGDIKDFGYVAYKLISLEDMDNKTKIKEIWERIQTTITH